MRLLSRASALAVLQADLVARALRDIDPSLEIVRITRAAEGDRDRGIDLAAAGDKGVFTMDLSRALLDGRADAVVHSWKDLPMDGPAGTRVAGTIARADPRDVLLVRRDVIDAAPAVITVLSSAPRRIWQITTHAARWLPWRVASVLTSPVRGNVPTRLRKLIAGEGDALIVAKAALDRLLSDDAPAAVSRDVRAALDRCNWMVLPLKEHPTAPAQGALAIEIAADRADLLERVSAIDDRATRTAVEAERDILASFGGGCHEAVGATVLERSYGRITSVRARTDAMGERHMWSLDARSTPPPSAAPEQIWPRPDERSRAHRHAFDVPAPGDDRAWWVARAEALPQGWSQSPTQIIWTAGSRTWERLARRGIWVNGCADGLGDEEDPAIDVLAGRSTVWLRLTHTRSDDRRSLATYAVDMNIPDDLPARTHFFWTSGSAFRAALGQYPGLRTGWHASGPGRTARTLRDTLGPARISVWLDYEQWHRHVTS